VTFTVKGGTTVGILGGTGSGKSTLVHLLDRLYELPEKCGRIRIGGTDIADLKASELRKNVGLVLQEPYLFSRTLEDNIRIGLEGASREDVQEASKVACLDTAISHFAEGYDTYVGERGVTLSGGQKQRTAIAQMLIRKPPILIFDDSLSAVDAKTDSEIRMALKKHTTSATVLLISHRITTLMQADQIIVLDRGRIAEMGTHEELLEKQGIYRKIYDLQMQQM
jgi:ATP-binding cassette subfamily B protein